jgi:hypothetical protein
MFMVRGKTVTAFETLPDSYRGMSRDRRPPQEQLRQLV